MTAAWQALKSCSCKNFSLSLILSSQLEYVFVLGAQQKSSLTVKAAGPRERRRSLMPATYNGG